MTISWNTPTVLATQAGPNVAASLLDANWAAAVTALSGLVAAMTDLPLSVNATGTRAWAQGAAIADAAAITLGSDGNYFVCNGTTTVTSISTKQAGCLVILRFAGARTLTHNATTLILMGATNATTASGDLYWFISEGGGNWREIWRRPVTGAVVTNVYSGAGTWITPPASAVTLEASSDTEGTTQSTSLADLRSLTSLSIATTKTIVITGNFRKTGVHASQVRLGLVLNAVEMLTGGTAALFAASAAADSGTFTIMIPPRTDANYPIAMQFTTTPNSAAALAVVNHVADGTLPTTTITTITMRGLVINATNTLGVNNIRVTTY